MIATKAMDILVSMQGKETVAVQKDEMDLSTSADIAAEKCVIDFVKEKYPTHGIYSEEIGEIKGTEPYRWVIDPLDQTKEYSRGLSEYNCLIAIEYNSEPIVGVSLQHGIDTTYTGSKGNGSYCNDKKMHVSDQSILANTFIGFNLPNRKNDPIDIEKDLSILSTCIPLVYRVRPFWDQAKVMGWVARGLLDGNIAPPHVFKWYDVASSIIVVKEAGGTITDWHGNPVTEQTFTNGIVASNGIIHTQLLDLIQKAINGN
jgi:myo-inositol-1(or 4)-monophosphatase